MIMHLSSRVDGACKKLTDLNEQVGEHVYAVAQSYAPMFIFFYLSVSIVCTT